MKKKWFFLIFFLIISTFSFAQRFEGGILAGFNGTQLRNDTLIGYHKPGILAGVWVQTDLAPAVFGGMELKFSQKGCRSRQNPRNTEIENYYVMQLNYIELPVFAGFRSSELISVIGGLSLGYLLSAYEKDEYGKFPQEDQRTFNNFDLQPFLGFQFDLLERIKIDLRMAFSVTPVIKSGQNGVDSFRYWDNLFNNVISLALYYHLDR